MIIRDVLELMLHQSSILIDISLLLFSKDDVLWDIWCMLLIAFHFYSLLWKRLTTVSPSFRRPPPAELDQVPKRAKQDDPAREFQLVANLYTYLILSTAVHLLHSNALCEWISHGWHGPLKNCFCPLVLYVCRSLRLSGFTGVNFMKAINVVIFIQFDLLELGVMKTNYQTAEFLSWCY